MEPTETSKQQIRSRYLGHVSGYQPIRDQYFLIRSVPALFIVKGQEPTEISKQPIRTHYLGHVTGYQPIRDKHFLIRSVPDRGNIDCLFVDPSESGKLPRIALLLPCGTYKNTLLLHKPNCYSFIKLFVDVQLVKSFNDAGRYQDRLKQVNNQSELIIPPHYLGHVTSYQQIREQYFLIWSVPEHDLKYRTVSRIESRTDITFSFIIQWCYDILATRTATYVERIQRTFPAAYALFQRCSHFTASKTRSSFGRWERRMGGGARVVRIKLNSMRKAVHLSALLSLVFCQSAAEQAAMNRRRNWMIYGPILCVIILILCCVVYDKVILWLRKHQSEEKERRERTPETTEKLLVKSNTSSMQYPPIILDMSYLGSRGTPYDSHATTLTQELRVVPLTII
eukprot:sb/3465422/